LPVGATGRNRTELCRGWLGAGPVSAGNARRQSADHGRRGCATLDALRDGLAAYDARGRSGARLAAGLGPAAGQRGESGTDLCGERVGGMLTPFLGVMWWTGLRGRRRGAADAGAFSRVHAAWARGGAFFWPPSQYEGGDIPQHRRNGGGGPEGSPAPQKILDAASAAGHPAADGPAYDRVARALIPLSPSLLSIPGTGGKGRVGRLQPHPTTGIRRGRAARGAEASNGPSPIRAPTLWLILLCFQLQALAVAQAYTQQPGPALCPQTSHKPDPKQPKANDY